MLYKPEILQVLLPSLTGSVSLVSIDLSCNKLTDAHADMLARIIADQQTRKDELKWLLSLRTTDARRPISQNILKQFSLAFNELKASGVRQIARVMKTDTYLRCLDLRGNLIQENIIQELLASFKENETLFNFDLRENPGFTPKYEREFALKMLANYGRAKQECEQFDDRAWRDEADFANWQLFDVKIPKELLESYSRKLNLINTKRTEQLVFTESSMVESARSSRASWRISDRSHYYSPPKRSPYRER
jgi:hypothetical protein